MTTKDILDSEKSNTDSIFLYSEGMFWKACEVSAYLFCTRIKQFKPTKRYVKAVNDQIVSIGFPKNGNYFDGMNVTRLDQNRIVVRGDYQIGGADDPEFRRWKESITEMQPQPKKQKQIPAVSSAPSQPPVPPAEGKVSLELQIARFNLEDKTPLQCMEFLARLKREIATIA